MRARPDPRRSHNLVGIVHSPVGIGLAQAMGTLNLGRAEILPPLQRHRIVRPLIFPTRQGRCEPPAPARPASFLPQRGQDPAERVGLHLIQDLPPLRVRRNRVHPADRLQVPPLALLLPRPLKLQQTRMLENHHRKATHYGVMEGITESVGGTRLFHGAESGRQQVDYCFSGETLEGTHLSRLAKRKNSRAPTPILRAFTRNRELLPRRGHRPPHCRAGGLRAKWPKSSPPAVPASDTAPTPLGSKN